MKSKQVWQIVVCGLVLAAISKNTLYSQPIPQPSASNTSTLSAKICTDVPNWQQPSLEKQREALEQNPRYGKEIERQPLKSLFTDLWNHQVFVFTEYGLSARIEPIYLSGVWTVSEDIWDCYAEEAVRAINSGNKAEIWLLGLSFVNLEWNDQQYHLTVETRDRGFQIIQFTRQESQGSLPLNVVNTEGQAIPFLDLKLPE